MRAKLLNTILRKVRYKYRRLRFKIGSYRYKRMMKRRFAPGGSFKFIQIGANDGVSFDDFYPFVTARKSSGLVVEPIGIYYKQLVQNYEVFPDILPIQAAIHDTEKEATIYYVNPEQLEYLSEWAAGIGSLDPNHHKKLGIDKRHVIEEKVRCLHLMDLIAAHQFFDIDMMQIDTEGYDAKVIQMIDFDRIKPKCIKYEYVNLAPAEHSSTEQLLKARGYKMLRLGIDSIAFLRKKRR